MLTKDRQSDRLDHLSFSSMPEDNYYEGKLLQLLSSVNSRELYLFQ